MIDRKEINVVPICGGEAHLQNEILSYKCLICGKKENEDMALIRYKDKQLVFVCLEHRGVIKEFINQFHRPPLGWIHVSEGVKPDGGQITSQEDKGTDSPM